MSKNAALSCAQSRQAIADYREGEIDLPLRAHLEGCKDCSAAWDRQQAVRELLGRPEVWPVGGDALDKGLTSIGEGKEPQANALGARPKRLLRKPLGEAGEADDTIGLYLREIGGIPLLSGEDEQSLAKAYEAGILATEQLSDPELVEGMSEDARRELRALVAKGERARSRLIQANSRLVVHIAKKYINHGVPFQDLIQEGNLGLMRAVEKFDYKKGFKFSTYATWWIRQAITRALADQSRTIRVPAHLAETISKLKAVTRRLEQELGRDPTTEEVAAELDLTPERVIQVLQIARRPISLEMPVGEDAESEYGDFLPDEVSPTPDDNVGRKLLREALDRALSELSDREAAVLAMRYGLLDGETHTLEEVGKRFGVTRERIRQIERKAIRRLRHPSRSGRLRDGLG